jgi:hypothetical protein
MAVQLDSFGERLCREDADRLAVTPFQNPPPHR